jgi:hypothetical protein
MKNNMFTKIHEQGEDGEDSEDTILFSRNREQEIAVIRQSLYSKLLTITLFRSLFIIEYEVR